MTTERAISPTPTRSEDTFLSGDCQLSFYETNEEQEANEGGECDRSHVVIKARQMGSA